MSQRMTLTESERAFVLAQRAARLATVNAGGQPSVVPVCYAYDGARFFSPLDEKPKRLAPSALRRVRDIAANPAVSLLIDRYDDDWSRLGFVQVRGQATLLAPGAPDHPAALRLLRERYPQYQTMALEERPVIAITPHSVVSWGPALTDSATAASVWTQPGRGLDFVPLARHRRAVRAFQERPVPRAALTAMLEAARWAPSPHGRQPWRFAVLTTPDAKSRLAEAMGADWQRTLEMDGQPPEIIATRLAKSHERIRAAPALILACLYLEDLDRYPDAGRQRAEEVMAIQSLGAAIQNMLLAAYALGLDTGWMCAPLFSPATVRAALDPDATLLPHALIPVGYAARDPKRRSHRPVDDLVVRWD